MVYRTGVGSVLPLTNKWTVDPAVLSLVSIFHILTKICNGKNIMVTLVLQPVAVTKFAPFLLKKSTLKFELPSGPDSLLS